VDRRSNLYLLYADTTAQAICKAFEFSMQRRMWRAAAIYSATAGVIFFGTPHRGSNHAAWKLLAEKLSALVLRDESEASVDALTRGAEVLERLQDSFSGLLDGMSVHSFFESVPSSGNSKVRGHGHESRSSSLI
jgi:hypothetical protein